MSRKRNFYSVKFQLQVIVFAVNFNNGVILRHHSVNAKHVREEIIELEEIAK